MKLAVNLDAREEVPPWITYGTPVFTVVAALVVSAIALIATGVNPVTAYTVMFADTLTTRFGLTEVGIKAVPLILAGFAVYLPMKAQLWNIGAEGQLFMGAVVGTWIGLNVSLPMYVLLPLMFVGAALAGAVWAGIPALLRTKWGINEIITTLLFTFIAADIKNYLVRGPMQSSMGNFPQTASLPTAARIPTIPLTGVHAGILVALAMAVVTYAVLNYTRFGFEIAFVGSNADAAEQAGMDKRTVYLFVLITGGVFAAFAGLSEIAGNQGRLRAFFAPGFGYTAIPIALLGRNGAFQVVVAAVFFAVIFVGGSSLGVALGVPAALVDIMQALIILFLITAEFFKRYEVSVSIRADSEAASQGRVGGGF